MRARRDVNQVVLAAHIERIRAREVVERAVDGLEVPRVLELDVMTNHVRLRGSLRDVGADDVRDRVALPTVEQLEPIDEEILVLGQRDGRTPVIPAPIAMSLVE